MVSRGKLVSCDFIVFLITLKRGFKFCATYVSCLRY